MIKRAHISDEALLGYSVFLAMLSIGLLALMGLGVFAYCHGPSPADWAAETQAPGAKTKRAPFPTTITLSKEAILVTTSPADTRRFYREDLGVVFADMLLRKVTPPLFIRCNPDVRYGAALEILIQARDAGIKDIRLVMAQEFKGE